jgi:serine/threonine protein kinase
MQAQRLGVYELIRQLGEGGMAQVYLARDVRLGREVAVKVLDQHLAAQTGFRERFLREARVAAKLDHPNIVPLFDFGEADYLWYLVMPYVSGGSLQDVLRRAPLSVGEVVTYGTQIADALEYAHGLHVVHRDVKPANMLIHADGRVMLSDFGLAKILDKSARPAAPRAHPDAGTPEYMAPEQIEGRTDERSDIYGLGVVLYLLLTGHLPFTGSTSGVVMEGHLYRLPEQPRTLNPAVTPAVQNVVLRALAKHPDDRYQRASDLGAALLGALVAGDAEPLPFALGAGPHTPISPVAARTPYATPWSSSGFASASDAATGTYPQLNAVQPAHIAPSGGMGGMGGMPDAFDGPYRVSGHSRGTGGQPPAAPLVLPEVFPQVRPQPIAPSGYAPSGYAPPAGPVTPPPPMSIPYGTLRPTAAPPPRHAYPVSLPDVDGAGTMPLPSSRPRPVGRVAPGARAGGLWLWLALALLVALLVVGFLAVAR